MADETRIYTEQDAEAVAWFRRRMWLLILRLIGGTDGS